MVYYKFLCTIQAGDVMGNYSFSVGELTSQIKRMGRMNLATIGNSVDEQNTYIYYYITQAMWKYVALACVTRTSDPLTVTADGYVTFQLDGQPVGDLYEQLRILDANGKSIPKRTSWEDTKGWYRESANSQLHIKGAGVYTLQYKGYPAKAATADQVLEWPSSSYDLLEYETIGKIKESLNDLEGANSAYAVADKLIPILIKANIDARNHNGYLSPNDAVAYRR